MTTIFENSDFIHLYLPSQNVNWPPTLLMLHGTGGNENDLIPLARALAPEANVLNPRGKVLENGRNRFFRRLAEGIFDIEDLKLRAQELAEFVEKSSNSYGYDLDKLVAVGYSNGANIAAALLLLFPRLCSAALLFRPMLPIMPNELPDLRGISIFIGVGIRDPIIPREQPEALAKVLSDSGADVVLNLENSDHGVAVEEITAAHDWLKTLPIFFNTQDDMTI